MRQFLDQLVVTPLADGVQWALQSRFRFYARTLDRVIEVPARFITDFASVPRIVWAMYPPWSRYSAGAIVHDLMYWEQSSTRAEADAVLREAMDVLGVDPDTTQVIYNAVHTFGHHAWNRNAELKASGYTKMASADANPPYASAA